MATYGVLTLGVVLVVALLAILLARRKTGGASDDREDARDLIGEEIDANIEALVESYLEARSDRGPGRPGTDCFGQNIELFIGDVLWRRAERSEPWLRDALREILVLERDAVWAEIRERVEAHLRRQSPAG